MSILIVENNIALSNSISQILSSQGYLVQTFSSGFAAIDSILVQPYELILLDTSLPDISGFEVMERIAFRKIPVMFITAQSDVDERLLAFRLGAQDYLVKPLEPLEILARVRAILKHSYKKENLSLLFYQNLCVNPDGHLIKKNGLDVNLKPLEFSLATYFIQHAGEVLTKTQIFDNVWGSKYNGEDRTLTNHICHIRKKLNWEKRLLTVYGVGFKLKPDHEP